jgi:putative NADH-flavin reductase
MKIVVFGASGNCGRHFVRLAADRGHAVTAVVRDGSQAEALANVTVARGDVQDAGFVASVLRGQDAVMSGLGMRYRHPWAARQSPDDFISSSTTRIVAACAPPASRASASSAPPASATRVRR